VIKPLLKLGTTGSQRLSRAKGVLGQVSLGKYNIMEDVPSGRLKHRGYESKISTTWTNQISAKPVEQGDLVCLLQGALRPTIIRIHEDHFDIIKITAEPPGFMEPIEWLRFS
jgi:hypothetical protein